MKYIIIALAVLFIFIMLLAAKVTKIKENPCTALKMLTEKIDNLEIEFHKLRTANKSFVVDAKETSQFTKAMQADISELEDKVRDLQEAVLELKKPAETKQPKKSKRKKNNAETEGL